MAPNSGSAVTVWGLWQLKLDPRLPDYIVIELLFMS